MSDDALAVTSSRSGPNYRSTSAYIACQSTTSVTIFAPISSFWLGYHALSNGVANTRWTNVSGTSISGNNDRILSVPAPMELALSPPTA